MQAKQTRSDILYMTTLDTGRCSHNVIFYWTYSNSQVGQHGNGADIMFQHSGLQGLNLTTSLGVFVSWFESLGVKGRAKPWDVMGSGSESWYYMAAALQQIAR